MDMGVTLRRRDRESSLFTKKEPIKFSPFADIFSKSDILRGTTISQFGPANKLCGGTTSSGD